MDVLLIFIYEVNGYLLKGLRDVELDKQTSWNPFAHENLEPALCQNL